MTPYFSNSVAALYLGDCLDVVPTWRRGLTVHCAVCLRDFPWLEVVEGVTKTSERKGT